MRFGVEQFRRGLQRHRLASSFLSVGPSGIGKRLFAHRLAQGLLCDTRPAERLRTMPVLYSLSTD